MHSKTGEAQLVSLRTMATAGAAVFDRHSHPFFEFTLVTDDECTIIYPPGDRPTSRNTLLYYHPGEVHGAVCSDRQNVRFWVVHFKAETETGAALHKLASKGPEKRVWALKPEQVESFQWMFLQMLNERSTRRSNSEMAVSSWLKLLLINVDRWTESLRGPVMPVPGRANPEVLQLWHQINESVGKSSEELRSLFSSPNYDSTRHGFKKTFGCSPREMLLGLRIEYAKNLLLESSLSIKEIATRVGYVRQHEFNRMFNRYVGMAPSHWRNDPLSRGKGT